MGAGLTWALVWSLLLYVTMSKLLMLVRCSHVQAAAAACCPSDLRAETGAGVPRRPARPAAASRHGTRILGIRTRRTGGRGRAGEGKVFITVGLHISDTCHKSGSTSFVLYISTLISIISMSPFLISLFSLLSNAFAIILCLQT